MWTVDGCARARGPCSCLYRVCLKRSYIFNLFGKLFLLCRAAAGDVHWSEAASPATHTSDRCTNSPSWRGCVTLFWKALCANSLLALWVILWS